MDISEIVDYAEKRSPGFAARIVPAHDGLIDEICALAKQPLPALYLQYLRRMGLEPAELTIPWLSLDPIEVADLLESGASTYSKDRFTLFAAHQPDPGQSIEHYYFDHQHAAAGDCLVVAFENTGVGKIDEKSVTPLFASFHELLLFWAARLFGLKGRPFHRQLQFQRATPGDARDNMKDCREVLEQAGCRPPLPPTARCWVGECSATTARVFQAPRTIGNSFFVDVGGPDSKDGQRICELVEDNLVRPQP